MTLCASFRALAFRTFDQLGKGRRVNHQPLEETFTDNNILELKDRHMSQIYSRIFNKREEGLNGADWEWWLTNSSRTLWLGLRVQAKVLHLESNKFTHLHYRSGKSYQLGKLKRESSRLGLIPLYCLYVHEGSGVRIPRRICRPLPHTPKSKGPIYCRSPFHAVELYGCSIASLGHIESLQKAGEINDLAPVMKKALPWHCLVCCSRHGGFDLPSRAWSMLKGEFGIKESRKRVVKDKLNYSLGPAVGLRDDPPHYVHAAMKGFESDTIPDGLRGVLVIVGQEER
jgi:hypothetical protein